MVAMDMSWITVPLEQHSTGVYTICGFRVAHSFAFQGWRISALHAALPLIVAHHSTLASASLVASLSSLAPSSSSLGT